MFLAHLPADELDALLAAGLEAFTPHTSVERSEREHQLAEVREQGYAYTIVDAADLAGPGEVNGPGWVDEPAD